ncbi:MAG: aspartate 1-decarboxylase [Actinobacteria bacterium]|nr:MAG: aspartate 1-decarboxylase [Actinomycetota bacterium]
MQRRMLKSKIHRATVTSANLDYIGSISIDAELLATADVMVGEQVHVVNITNGARFETYAIAGAAGEVCLNGAAARLVQPGDSVIIISYADYCEAELAEYSPIVVHVGPGNAPVSEHVARELVGGPAHAFSDAVGA